MYPQNPNVTAWRVAAAKSAKAQGVPVPDWYDGTDSALSRLMSDDNATASAVRWFQNAYVIANPTDFPAAHLTAAQTFLAKNPGSASYGAQFATIAPDSLLTQAGQFVSAAADQAVKNTTDGFASAKSLLGISEPDKPDNPGTSWVTLALVGAAVGAVAWYGFGKKGAA